MSGKKKIRPEKGSVVGNCIYLGESEIKIKGRSASTFKCECGNEFIADFTNVKVGNVKLCSMKCSLYTRRALSHGCSRRNKKSAEYRCWVGMKTRCKNTKINSYKNYGGRGIKICERWDKFENFLEDMGERPSPKHSIDRIDVNGNYEPNNCRWATAKEQANNTTRNFHITCGDKTLTLSQWSDLTGLKDSCIESRLKRGWDVSKALTTKKRETNRVVIDMFTGVYFEKITDAAFAYDINRQTLSNWLHGHYKNHTNLSLV